MATTLNITLEPATTTTTTPSSSTDPLPLQTTPAVRPPHLSSTQTLENLLNQNIKLTSQINSLRIFISIRELLTAFKTVFEEGGLELSSIRLMGSTATAILLEPPQPEKSTSESGNSAGTSLMSSYPDDFDFVFRLKNPPENFRKVLQLQIRALCGLFKIKRKMTVVPYDCYNMFIHQFYCADTASDKWSMISLGSLETVVDVKVLYTCSRNYAFSIDSFEIELDPLLSANYTANMRNNNMNNNKKNNNNHNNSKPGFRGNRNGAVTFVVPEITVYSNYPNMEEALSHLRNRVIRTDDFANIHHGLYRYCLELARGYKLDVPGSNPANNSNAIELILIQKFWEEFELSGGMSGLKMNLSKFVAKHRKHWFDILSHFYDVLSRYSPIHHSSSDVLEVILKMMFIKN